MRGEAMSGQQATRCLGVRWGFGALLGTAVAAGCSSFPSSQGGVPEGGGGGDDSGSGMTADTGGQGTPDTSVPFDSGSGGDDTGSQDEPVVCVTGTGPASLPFAVDQYFIASGWMQAPLITQTPTCTRPGADPGDAGDGGAASAAKCWAITYTPAKMTDWAGVDWQYPANNWGTMPGRVIPAGATKVSFYAWGAKGGEKVGFNVGYGVTSPDGFGATLNQVLTTTPTQYSISLAGLQYTCNSARMGFGWTTSGGSPVSFFIDSVVWE
jgi:hypothetical protein